MKTTRPLWAPDLSKADAQEHLDAVASAATTLTFGKLEVQGAQITQTEFECFREHLGLHAADLVRSGEALLAPYEPISAKQRRDAPAATYPSEEVVVWRRARYFLVQAETKKKKTKAKKTKTKKKTKANESWQLRVEWELDPVLGTQRVPVRYA